MLWSIFRNDVATVARRWRTLWGAWLRRIAHVFIQSALIQLSSGCICFTLREDLLREVERLAVEGRFEYLLIESTEISEPLPVAEMFIDEDKDGCSLINVAKLGTTATVSTRFESEGTDVMSSWIRLNQIVRIVGEVFVAVVGKHYNRDTNRLAQDAVPASGGREETVGREP